MDPKKFFGELKRRNVYRAAVAYGVVAWFLTQLTTQVFPFFEIPNAAIRFVVIALAVGFSIEKATVDLTIFSQALHHAIRPERALAAAHRMLKKNGRLVILDLLAHRFEKARELYADHWLGFSEVQLHELLQKAGFKNTDVRVVSREKQSPHFQTVFATGVK